MSTYPLYIGCAGWSIPALCKHAFPLDGSHLQRYAQRLGAVEIDSSFYRPHLPTTYARWADVVPDDFRFAVKLPKEITHTRRLNNAAEPLEHFLEETAHLGVKRGPLLAQLPPSLRFDARRVEAFWEMLRTRYKGDVVCEPRHETWFTPQVEAVLTRWNVARVAADPAVVPVAAEPGGSSRLVYYRLHGAPRMYYSNYDDAYLATLAQTLKVAAQHVPVWCIFDNTAEGAATSNALQLAACLADES